ncbi:hypothetical protein Q4534_11760 [Cyclobacterium sp. 1_MG-2023]|uniref:hypothetical protein n=1 Tax=Cyclobacterium sp. 1_MG-2023 TaxID=3062681 RepID=UPI0026E308FC|nr:hypothetical protein [Cyclobacterium sp. 1_MG-2023]MDO6438091.1 hypothetical protein [Cyclobacterium sp. 1_MG-2023]
MKIQTIKWLLVVMVSLMLNSFGTVSEIKFPIAITNTEELKNYFQDVYSGIQDPVVSFVGIKIMN